MIVLDHRSHTWADGAEPFRSSWSNADPEHSVDGRRAEAGHSSVVPIGIFFLLAAALMLLYAQLSS